MRQSLLVLLLVISALYVVVQGVLAGAAIKTAIVLLVCAEVVHAKCALQTANVLLVCAKMVHAKGAAAIQTANVLLITNAKMMGMPNERRGNES